jgi:hypothetical protein
VVNILFHKFQSSPGEADAVAAVREEAEESLARGLVGLGGAEERVVGLRVTPDERGEPGVCVDVPELVSAEGWAAVILDGREFGIERGERGFAFDQSFPVDVEGQRAVGCLVGGGCCYYYCARV